MVTWSPTATSGSRNCRPNARLSPEEADKKGAVSERQPLFFLPCPSFAIDYKKPTTSFFFLVMKRAGTEERISFSNSSMAFFFG